MSEAGDIWIAMAIVLGMVVLAFIAGSSRGNLSRMEVVAAVHTAKQEVGWTFERYRIESLRMQWMALPLEARREYLQTWGRPTWSKDSKGPVLQYLGKHPDGDVH